MATRSQQPLGPPLAPDGPWFNAFDLSAISASALANDSAADTHQAFADLTRNARLQYQLSLVYDGHDLRPEAIQAAERSQALAQAAASELSTSAQAQTLLAESAGRLGWIGGMAGALVQSVRAATAIHAAGKLAPTDPDLLEAKARLHIYMPGVLGGKPAESAAYFAKLAEASDAGGWNAYWCAEAHAQAGKKDAARRYYQLALTDNPAHKLAQRQLDKLK